MLLPTHCGITLPFCKFNPSVLTACSPDMTHQHNAACVHINTCCTRRYTHKHTKCSCSPWRAAGCRRGKCEGAVVSGRFVFIWVWFSTQEPMTQPAKRTLSPTCCVEKCLCPVLCMRKHVMTPPPPPAAAGVHTLSVYQLNFFCTCKLM